MKCLLFLLLLLPGLVDGQVITTVGGNGASSYSGDGGLATVAGIPNPRGASFDKYGNFYFADGAGSQRVRKIDLTGIITTVAGNGTGGFSGDGGTAIGAMLNGPLAVQFDTVGNLYIVDQTNNRVRKIDMLSGNISTFVGNGGSSSTGDGGLATAATIKGPADICFDYKCNLYICEENKVRKINVSGIISTFAGVGSPGGYSGDGGPATDAQLNGPTGICADKNGNIYIAERINNRVRKVDTFGIITTYVGNGSSSFTGDGVPATSAGLVTNKLGFDFQGRLFIADDYNQRIYMVDTIGIIHSVVGNGTAGYSGDGGLATTAQISRPYGIAFDSCGNLYFPEAGNTNRRIRKVTYPSTPSVVISAASNSSVGNIVTVNAVITGGCCSSFSYQWMKNGVVFATTATATTTYTKTAGNDSITVKVTGCGDTAISSVHVVITNVGVIDLKSTVSNIHLYPNPAHSELNIASDQKIQSAIIYNLLGQVVDTGTSEVIDIKDFKNGIYFVKVSFGDGSVVVDRFVKE